MDFECFSLHILIFSFLNLNEMIHCVNYIFQWRKSFFFDDWKIPMEIEWMEFDTYLIWLK